MAENRREYQSRKRNKHINLNMSQKKKKKLMHIKGKKMNEDP